MTGVKQEENWNVKASNVDFFYMKGVVEKVLQRLGLHQGISSSMIQSDLLCEGLLCKIRKKKVLEYGVVRKSILKKFGIKQEVMYADFNWDLIMTMLKDQKIKCKEVSKFPSVRRDLALLVDKKITYAEIESIAFQCDKNLLKKVSLFDVFEGDKLPSDKKSYALSFLFCDEEKTLTDRVVDKLIFKIFKTLEQKINVALRDGTLK